MKTVIMAGGKGTRIASVDATVPKPMIEINGKPILEYQIDNLKSQGLVNIVLVIGHLGHIIRNHFGDGSLFGVTIEYIEEKEPLGTAGALYLLKKLITNDFLLINGDLIFDVDIERFINYHKSKGGVVTLLTHPNDHPYDSAVIEAEAEGLVTRWVNKEEKRGWYKNRVNSGIHILSPKIFDKFTDLKKVDLDRDILQPMIEEKNVYAYDSPEYVKDVGTPNRLKEVGNDIFTGKLYRKNLLNKQKAIFLDRDGTINKYVGFLKDIDAFELEDGAASAIKMINRSGYLAIVITNQPVIARGELTWEQLIEIHNKMETLLGEQGAYIDDIFTCPHHPDKGFAGERAEYKIVCNCRKPKPGMIYEAAKKYNIDLTKSYMIGDSETDIQAGIQAGCKAVRVNNSLFNSIQEIKELVNNIGE